MIPFHEAVRRFLAEKGSAVRWRHLAQWFLRDERLRPQRSLRFGIPLYLASLLAIITGSTAGTVPPSVSKWFCVAILVCLVSEAVLLLLSLFRYLSEMVFMPAAQRASELLRLNPETEMELKRMSKAQEGPTDADLMRLATNTLNNEVLAGEVLRRLATFGLFGVRLVAAFVVATIALVYLQPTGGPDKDVFQNVQMSLGLPYVAERALYLNLVVIATLGFGDMAPVHTAWPARILTDIEIVTAGLLVLFGVNVLVGLMLEGSAAAWSQRREILQEHFRKVIADERDATR